MNQFKIINGTPKSGKSLCYSCQNAAVIKGQNFEQRIVCRGDWGKFLNVWGEADAVKFPVAECSLYRDKNSASLEEMERIAWVVMVRKRGQTGFASGQQTDPDDLEMVITPPKSSEKPSE
jgi:hypothetical protein